MPWIAVAIAVLLSLPMLSMGPMLDDLAMRYVVEGIGPFPGGPRGVWDLYRFADGGPGVKEAIDVGLFPWCAAPDLKLAFFRPLSSLWVAFDHSVFPEDPWAWHTGSIALYAGLVLVIAKLYGRFVGGAAAGLAVLLYAIDDAHAMPVLWASNRHTVVSAFFGFAALLAHAHKKTAAGVLLFAAALAGGESATGVLPYFLTFAWFMDDRGRRAALWALAPYGVLLVAWLVIYGALGYGASGSGGYVHPTQQPGRFILAVFERGPQILLGQLFGPPADVWMMLPRHLRVGFMVGVPVVIIALSMLLLRAARHPSRWFFALGALGSIVPLCATFPADRMLLFPGFGVFGLMAIAIARVTSARLEGSATRTAAGLAALALVVHLVFAPLLFLGRTKQSYRVFGEAIERGAASLPEDAHADQQAIVVYAPDGLMTMYIFLKKLVSGRGFAAGARVLTIAQEGTVRVERTSDRALTISVSQGGMFSDALSSVYRDAPFEHGVPTRVGDLTATVRELSPAGYPTAVSFVFDAPLGGDKQRWLVWEGAGFRELALPAEGESVEIQATDFLSAYDR